MQGLPQAAIGGFTWGCCHPKAQLRKNLLSSCLTFAAFCSLEASREVWLTVKERGPQEGMNARKAGSQEPCRELPTTLQGRGQGLSEAGMRPADTSGLQPELRDEPSLEGL